MHGVVWVFGALFVCVGASRFVVCLFRLFVRSFCCRWFLRVCVCVCVCVWCVCGACAAQLRISIIALCVQKPRSMAISCMTKLLAMISSTTIQAREGALVITTARFAWLALILISILGHQYCNDRESQFLFHSSESDCLLPLAHGVKRGHKSKSTTTLNANKQ